MTAPPGLVTEMLALPEQLKTPAAVTLTPITVPVHGPLPTGALICHGKLFALIDVHTALPVKLAAVTFALPAVSTTVNVLVHGKEAPR